MQIKDLNPAQLLIHGLAWCYGLLKPLPKLTLPDYPSGDFVPKVLIVEDNIFTRSFLETEVKITCGAEILLAGSVQEAAVVIEEEKDDLDFMLLDWLLKDEDGMKVIEAWQIHVDGPVLVLSGHGALIDSILDKLHILGVHNVLLKPADLGVLTSILHRYTAQSKLKKQFRIATAREALSLAHVKVLNEEIGRLKLAVTAMLITLIFQILAQQDFNFDLSALVAALKNLGIFD